MCASRSDQFLRVLYRLQVTEGYPKLHHVACSLDFSPVVVAAIARDLLRVRFVERIATCADGPLGISLLGRMHIGVPLTE